MFEQLSIQSLSTLIILLAVMGAFEALTFLWQIQVPRGRSMSNADGSIDDWHEQKILYGMAFADIVLACPACIVGVILAITFPKTGIYILSLVAIWFLWANTMTTTTSLRYEQPKLNVMWWRTFPTGALVGLAFIIWVAIHFVQVFVPNQ